MKRVERILAGTLLWAIVAGAGPALEAAAEGAPEAANRLVASFLEAAKAVVHSPADLPALQVRLRPLLAEIDAVLAELRTLPERVRAAGRARAALADGLTALFADAGSRAAVDELLGEAARLHRNRRIAALESRLICWCKDEDWTRTLAGCPDGCAQEQKMLIGAWIDEGATSDEIVQRMVEHPKGGPRVRAAPEARGVSWIGYLAPAAIFAVALAVVMVFLRRALRRRTEASASASTPTSIGGSDDALDEQIERELKEMEG